ncbi:amidohydrolase family protein [Paenibacillus lycopersici]|uniref:Amidohydrolase family protein n=1 Tax=Paenibacillus lycopersici TaxID=2704462 RepID=A0A6C0FZM3_9BACL|nr:amidohydrolase [Paenibacillus lycopersici]QHT60973.1 amidohydrolase family protein [Paenibacillus lycopersici]
MHETYWLKNVRLETGHVIEDGVITGTTTDNYHLLIENGRIAVIALASETQDAAKAGESAGCGTGESTGIGTEESTAFGTLPALDAQGLLALPSFVERHCHLDKTLLGDRWRPVRPASSLFERFDIEKNTLPKLATTMKARAETLLGTLLRAGSTHVRTHVDVYPEAGLRHLEAIQEAIAAFEGKLNVEIVAFPQHGLLRTQSVGLVREALARGCRLVGGVDPATVDGDMERSLQRMMELAVEADADVDLHLHDGGSVGLATIKRLAQLTEEAGWQGRVAISHAFALGDMAGTEAEQIAELLAGLGMTIITSVPMGRVIPPVPFLQAKGVAVAVGCDNIFDSWSPFGNGDILERAGRLAERFGWSTEQALADSLRYITGGRTPLDRQGGQAWPKPGDEASIVLAEASCSAEAVARRANRPAVLYQGKVVSGSLKEAMS